MKPKDILFLVWHSIRSILLEWVELFEALKKPQTWSFISYAILFLSLYYRRLDIAKVLLPFVLLLYVIRQSKNPSFHKEVRKRAFLKNDEEAIQKYYDKYKKNCIYSKKEPLSYEDLKKRETERLR